MEEYKKIPTKILIQEAVIVVVITLLLYLIFKIA